MPRRRGDQSVEHAGGLDFVLPAEHLHHALHMAATLASVLHQIQVLVGSDLLDADEHGAAPCCLVEHHVESSSIKMDSSLSLANPRIFSTTKSLAP